MTFVDYAGPIFPIIAHSPWNGLRLADFVMPFFLFVAGVSLAIVYKVLPPSIIHIYALCSQPSIFIYFIIYSYITQLLPFTIEYDFHLYMP